MSQPYADSLIRNWYRKLELARHPTAAWYRERHQGEKDEYNEASTRVEKLSEKSDVYFALLRGKYDGFPIDETPKVFTLENVGVYAYMVGKYSMRWGFYRATAWMCKGSGGYQVNEVVNPMKDAKLEDVARRYPGIDPVELKRMAKRLRWVWPLFP